MINVVSCNLLLSVSVVMSVPPLTPEQMTVFKLVGKIQPGSSDDVVHHGMRTSFKKKYVGSGGAIQTYPGSGYWLTVEATSAVSERAHQEAATIVSRMTKYMPSTIFHNLASHAKVGVFTKSETLTVFPEYAYLRDTPSCHNNCAGSCSQTCTFDGRKYSTLAGTGGRVAAILDDNILCDSRDPYHRQSNILVHEFTHTIHTYALPSSIKSQITAAYQHAKANNLWQSSSYAMSNEQEYFAEGAGTYFNSEHLSYSTGGMNTCSGSLCTSETATRYHLWQHDVQLYNVLTYVFTNSRPSLHGNIGTCIA